MPQCFWPGLFSATPWVQKRPAVLSGRLVAQPSSWMYFSTWPDCSAPSSLEEMMWGSDCWCLSVRMGKEQGRNSLMNHDNSSNNCNNDGNDSNVIADLYRHYAQHLLCSIFFLVSQLCTMDCRPVFCIRKLKFREMKFAHSNNNCHLVVDTACTHYLCLSLCQYISPRRYLWRYWLEKSFWGAYSFHCNRIN